MQPPAHRPPTPWQIEHARICREERELFFQNLDLILAHAADILRCDEYFFCRPAFASFFLFYPCGHINVGTLLLGWRTGILMDKCSAKTGARKEPVGCPGKAYVYHFGGTGGGTRWSAFCTSCGGCIYRPDNGKFRERMAFATSVNEQMREWVEGLELEHFPSQKFSFGEPALVPSTTAMMRKSKLSLITPVTVAELVDELKRSDIRKPTPADRTLVRERIDIMREGIVVETIMVRGDSRNAD